MPINSYTQNIYGCEVDGWYWTLLKESFKAYADRYRTRREPALLPRSPTTSPPPPPMCRLRL